MPDFLQRDALRNLREKAGIPVTVRLASYKSLNERFRPLKNWGEGIRTRGVMVLDDNVVLRKQAIEWGWHEWVRANHPHPKKSPRAGRLVGFTGRDWLHHTDRIGQEAEFELTGRPKERVGMVLTNAAWLKTEWLEAYWDQGQEMTLLRSHVDQGQLAFVGVLVCDNQLTPLAAPS